MESLSARYRAVMVRTRIISILASAWMLTLTLKEIVSVASAVYLAESLDWNVAFAAILSPALVGGAFVGRLISLARIEKLPYSSVALSWLVCAVFLWVHFKEVFPGGADGAVYSLIRFDLLAGWTLVFIFFSLLRFLITACFTAATRSHEVDSYS